MKTIYSSFDDFSKRNQSILNIISDKEDLDLLRAIWDARDGEILRLEMRIQRQNKEESRFEERIREQGEINKKLLDEINQLKSSLSENEALNHEHQDKLSSQSKRIQILENDFDALSVESDQLEKILFSKDKEIDRLESAIKQERKEYEVREENNKALIERSIKLEESFDSDQKYIKEIERQLKKISGENKELTKIKAEYSEQFSAQKKLIKQRLEEASLLNKQISDYKNKLEKKESLLLGLSEKLNSTQAELTVALSKAKKLNAQVERLEFSSKELKTKTEVFGKENIELKRDNVEIVSYCESVKKELQSLELSNEDLFSNQKELEAYITKLRKKASRDEIKLKELEKSLEEEQLRKKLALNEKHLIQKELQDYKGLLSDFESKLKKPKRVSNITGRSLDH